MGERVTFRWTEIENGEKYRYYIEFEVHEDYVREIGTPLNYDPATKKGYQIDRNGQRIALTSYGVFGSDIYHAHEAAEHWCEKAQKAYDMVYGK